MLSRPITKKCYQLITLLGVVGFLALSGCASEPEQLEQVERSAEELYNTALNEAQTGNISNSSSLFEEVERQHPYSEWATQSQLMAAWALYSSGHYTEAVASLDRFTNLNPAHPDVDYAYYLKAQSYYEQIVDVERDAGMTHNAREAFSALIGRFPNSHYARDAELKFDLTTSHLAGKQMAIGRYYLQAGHYGAALRRFERVIETYDSSNQTPEAIYRMIEAYTALGLSVEAERSATVLQYNFPDSIWTERMYRFVHDPEENHESSLFKSFVDWFAP